MDSRGGQSVLIVLPITVKDPMIVSGGRMGCQHFGEFTIRPISGYRKLKTSLSLEQIASGPLFMPNTREVDL